MNKILLPVIRGIRKFTYNCPGVSNRTIDNWCNQHLGYDVWENVLVTFYLKRRSDHICISGWYRNNVHI